MNRAISFTAAASLALSLAACSSFEYKPVVPYDTTEQVLFGTMLAGQAADVISTQDGLSRGCVEGNPLFGENPSPALMIGVKMASVALTTWAVNRTADHKTRKLLLLFSTVMGGGMAAYNYSLDCN